MAKLTLHIADGEDALAAVAAERLTALVEQATAARGSAMVSLTGGSTPRLLYRLLADDAQPWRARIDWARVHLFWGDERHVPPDHPDSNFGMANEALIRHVPIPPAQVHRMRGEIADAAEAARHYDRELRDAFAAAARIEQVFDVMLLGLGEDAHIASIFPGSELLAGYQAPPAGPAGGWQRRPAPSRDAPTAAVWAPHLNAWRITLTPAAILASHAIVVVVAGEGKADAVYAALMEPADVARRPAQLLHDAAVPVEWILDRAAAARLADDSGDSGADAPPEGTPPVSL